MSATDIYNKCKLCGGDVIKNSDSYDVFEQMHWLCFHIMFEHDGDVDVVCSDPWCPWFLIQTYEEKLKSLGHDPQDVHLQAVRATRRQAI